MAHAPRTPLVNAAEIVSALRVGQESTEALKVFVDLLTFPFAVDVRPHIVRLPDLNNRIANWRARKIQNFSRQVRYLANRRRDRIVDHQQVVVRIQW